MGKKILKIFWILGIAAVFLGGVIAGAAVGPVHLDSNVPTGHVIKEKTDEVVNSMNPLNMGVSTERPSPSDWISDKQVEVYSDRIILDIKDAQWAVFTNTNSMDPVIDEHASAIEIEPETEVDIEVGDIVSYKSDYADGTIIHRVVYKGKDEQGTYFVMKGDNNPTNDPGKVRFDQIKRVLVAIIY